MTKHAVFIQLTSADPQPGDLLGYYSPCTEWPQGCSIDFSDGRWIPVYAPYPQPPIRNWSGEVLREFDGYLAPLPDYPEEADDEHHTA